MLIKIQRIGLFQGLIVEGDYLPLALHPFSLCHDFKHVVELQESIAVINIISFIGRTFFNLVPAIPIDDGNGLRAFPDFSAHLLTLVESDILAGFPCYKKEKISIWMTLYSLSHGSRLLATILMENSVRKKFQSLENSANWKNRAAPIIPIS